MPVNATLELSCQEGPAECIISRAVQSGCTAWLALPVCHATEAMAAAWRADT